MKAQRTTTTATTATRRRRDSDVDVSVNVNVNVEVNVAHILMAPWRGEVIAKTEVQQPFLVEIGQRYVRGMSGIVLRIFHCGAGVDGLRCGWIAWGGVCWCCGHSCACKQQRKISRRLAFIVVVVAAFASFHAAPRRCARASVRVCASKYFFFCSLTFFKKKKVG